MAFPGLSASLLYKTATFLNAISIPGHIALGLETVHPVLNIIVTASKSDGTAGKVSRRNLGGKRSAQACFNCINGSLLIAGKSIRLHNIELKANYVVCSNSELAVG
jgi:hypothetical protein